MNQCSSHEVGRIAILVPQHVSASPPSNALFLHVPRSAGVAWRALFPMLIQSPAPVCRMLLKILLKSMSSSTGRDIISRRIEGKDRRVHPEDGFWQRTIPLKGAFDTTIVLVPPVISYLDRIFTSVVLRTEHSLLQRQTLSAWFSTLGGGYFFCKRLHISLQLARQQRCIALGMGNISMARQCQVNEAYNFIYAGKFKAANLVLDDLEANSEAGSLTLRQCQAARLLAKRLKQVKKRGLKGYNTSEKGEKHAIDDYQRIRIVEA